MGLCASAKADLHQSGEAAQEDPHREPTEISFTLTRDAKSSLGLRLVRRSGLVYISGVREGSRMEQWNLQNPSLEVLPGDRLFSVNGMPARASSESFFPVLAAFRSTSVDVVILRTGRGQGRGQGLASRPNGGKPATDRLLPINFLEELLMEPGDPRGCGDCAVCLEALAGERNVVLPCGHAFHFACADAWLSMVPTFRRARCPVCRTPRMALANSGGKASGSSDASEQHSDWLVGLDPSPPLQEEPREAGADASPPSEREPWEAAALVAAP